MIHLLISEIGEARASEIAKRLGVSKVTVSKTIQRLDRDGYVIAKSYQPIELTDKGKKLAIAMKERHEIVLSFLKRLGVSDSIAEVDTEGIEHHVSEETLEAMKQFLQKK